MKIALRNYHGEYKFFEMEQVDEKLDAIVAGESVFVPAIGIKPEFEFVDGHRVFRQLHNVLLLLPEDTRDFGKTERGGDYKLERKSE